MCTKIKLLLVFRAADELTFTQSQVWNWRVCRGHRTPQEVGGSLRGLPGGAAAVVGGSTLKPGGAAELLCDLVGVTAASQFPLV